MKGAINVWSGYYGQYVVPNSVTKGIRFNKSGMPDGRNKAKRAKFMEWVSRQEATAAIGLIDPKATPAMKAAKARRKGSP